MSNEIKNTNAIELSSEELDMVAGGNGCAGGFGVSGSEFKQFDIAASDATFAGPKGASTQQVIQAHKTESSAFTGLGFSDKGKTC